MKSTVVDESLSSFKPMYCYREYQASTRLIQQYEKSTSNPSTYLTGLWTGKCKGPLNMRENGEQNGQLQSHRRFSLRCFSEANTICLI